MLDVRKIWSSKQLPTPPAVALRLLELSRRSEVDIREIISAIKSDPAISARILKASNSTFFGFASKITTIDQAVPLLGTTMVTSLALSFSVVEAAVTQGPLADHYQQYWLHSIVQGAAADLVATRFHRAKEGEVFVGGLLMDLGRLAMLKAVPKDYLPAITAWIEQPERSLADIERELLGTDHCRIGAELMKNWSLPESFQMLARLHHGNCEALLAVEGEQEQKLIRSCGMAAAIGDYFCTPDKGRALERLRQLSQEFYQLTEDALQSLLTTVKARVDTTGDLMSVNTTTLPEPEELMSQACEQLAQLAMREHVATSQALARQQVAEEQQRHLEVKNAELRQQTLHDALTAIYNRAYFDEVLEKEVQRCCRTAETLGVIFTDIDRFKKLNDTFGHPFGDQVLQRVAGCMRECIRGSDTLARYGGEEFVVLIVQPTEKGIERIAQRLRARIESERFRHGDSDVQVTASFGAALTIPGRHDAGVGKRLVAAADEAMYQAKQSGGNAVRLQVVLAEHDRRLMQLTLQKRFSRWLVQRGTIDVETVSRALVRCEKSKLRIGELACSWGLMDQAAVEQVLREQEQCDLRFGEIALKQGLLTEDQLASLLAVQQEDPHDLASRLLSQGAFNEFQRTDHVDSFLAERSAVVLV